MDEAACTSDELRALDLNHQRLAINGVLHASDRNDTVARAIEDLGRQALQGMPGSLRVLPQDHVPLQGLDALADELAAAGHGLIMLMGKGGVGKTTVAAALALGQVQRGKSVHLSTTDPAAHLAGTLNGDMPGLQVSRIDPKVETQRCIEKIMAAKPAHLDVAARALLLEDLQSPSTEEVAAFHAFSRYVGEGRSAFVVLDTAPTGHSMLLMDAMGAYHRQMTRELEGHAVGRVSHP